MRSGIIVIVTLVLLFLAGEVSAQSESNLDNKILFRKEWSAYLIVHTGGWGIGYRNGKHKTALRKRMWEIEFVSMKHPKEKKVVSSNDNSRSFVYGKLNYVYILRGAYGLQKILNGKPYWGGVELRWSIFGGASVAITKPVYLWILRKNPDTQLDERVAERYDPEQHNVYNIYGRGPFFKGFDHLGFYPGIYARTGLNFEFGANDEVVKSLECGAILDYYPIAIPIMAYNPKNSLFLSLYLSLHFGQRKN